MLKKVLNLHEEATHRRLSAACDHWGAQLFAKIRIADILPIENSGISNDLYRFALQGHFDFLVADSENAPLFAVEFDGESHKTPEQRQRDAQKDELCERFELPILRINSRYLLKRYRDTDLLSWFVDYWFLSTGFTEAQDKGLVPPDEGFDSLAVHSISGRDKKWPLWLSVDLVSDVRKMSDSGKCWDPGLSHVVGTDERGNYYAVGYIRVTAESGIFVRTAMRAQRFPADVSEALSFIVDHELFLKLKAVLAGKETAVPVVKIDTEIQEFRCKYTFMSAMSCSRGPVNHPAI